jgi:hypothetical protein
MAQMLWDILHGAYWIILSKFIYRVSHLLFIFFALYRWADGYDMRFGLFYVDYTDENRRRYAKDSAYWYRDYILSKQNSTSWKNLLSNAIFDSVDMIVSKNGVSSLLEAN